MIGPYPLNSIITGDARELARAIPDESIDLVFTDPIYSNIDDYRWLAETAARVLKPDSACLVWCGIGYLPETIDALRAGGLTYRWELTSAWNGGAAHAPIGFCKQARCLWFDVDGKSKPYRQLVDYRQSVVNASKLPDSAAHDWTKIPDHSAYWLDGFTLPGDVVMDCFSGWGTTAVLCKLLNRRFLCFEIELDRADLARQRVLNTQPPLPFEPVRQMEIFEAEKD